VIYNVHIFLFFFPWMIYESCSVNNIPADSHKLPDLIGFVQLATYRQTREDCYQWSRLSRGCTVDHRGWHTYNILIRIIHTHICNISIKLGVGSYVEASRVLIRIVLAPALGARVARLIRALFHLGFIFRDSDGNIVDRYLVRLRGATVDIFQTRRMPVFAPQFVQFAFLLLNAAGRATATPFFLARFQKWYILLLRNLLSYQLGVYAGFPRRGSFADVTHEALKCFRCIPISADTAVPIIFFQNLRLAFSASRMVHCSLKSIVERCTFSKESFPSFEAPSASWNFAVLWTPDNFQLNVTKDMQ